MGCPAMSSHKPVRNNAIVQEVNNWYRHIEGWYSLPTSCGKLSCEKVSYKCLYIWQHIYTAWQPLISYVYPLLHRKAYHLRLAVYTFICNLWIALYQYFNSCTIALFLTGLWLDITWHEPIWPVMAFILKNSSDCSCLEILYSRHNVMYIVTLYIASIYDNVQYIKYKYLVYTCLYHN